MSAEHSNCTTRQNPIDARIQQLLDDVSGMSALIVGAVTLVTVQQVADALPLGNTATAIAVLPITLVVLYVLLWTATRLERGRR